MGKQKKHKNDQGDTTTTKSKEEESDKDVSSKFKNVKSKLVTRTRSKISKELNTKNETTKNVKSNNKKQKKEDIATDNKNKSEENGKQASSKVPKTVKRKRKSNYENEIEFTEIKRQLTATPLQTDLKSEKSVSDISNVNKVNMQSSDSGIVVDDGSSSNSEWEEVEDAEENTNLDDYNPEIPKEGVEITLTNTDTWKHRKRERKEFDLADIIRRQVNRFLNDVQIDIHRVHLLCLFAYGKYLNTILLDEDLMALMLSLIPTHFHNSKLVNDKFVSEIVKWYRGHFQCCYKVESSIVKLNNCLVKSIQEQQFDNVRDFSIVFILLVRSLGLEARLCLSLYPLPIKRNIKKKNIRSKATESKAKRKVETAQNKSNSSDSTTKIKSEGKTTDKIENKKAKTNKETKIQSNKKKIIKEEENMSSDSDFESNNSSIKSRYKFRNKTCISLKEDGSDFSDDHRDENFEVPTSGSKECTSADDTSDDDFQPSTSKTKSQPCVSSESTSKYNFPIPEINESTSKLKKTKKPNRKILSSDSEVDESSSILPETKRSPKQKTSSDYDGNIEISSNTEPGLIEHWIEIYSVQEEKWISVDCVNNIVDKPRELENYIKQPITYILGFDNDNCVKDVTRRYASKWMTDVRKLRVNPEWWEESLLPFTSQKFERNKKEDRLLDQMLIDQPFPTTIGKFKDHPLYVLKRHLLKFQAIYPSDAPTLGFIRKEPIYARECVRTLHSRETWVKEARVVRVGEEPYKIVKARPKWNKVTREIETDLPLEVFGVWQTEEYVPPVAKDGKVPRNEYGNVELFQPSMLPVGTVYLQLPGLNRIARKLNIDCSPALVGFDGNWGNTHPVFDGWVVCEEFREVLIAAWEEEQENQRKKGDEKREKRIYDNWKRLIKGLLIREKIKNKYKN